LHASNQNANNQVFDPTIKLDNFFFIFTFKTKLKLTVSSHGQVHLLQLLHKDIADKSADQNASGMCVGLCKSGKLVN
jgi:hypothetical protein